MVMGLLALHWSTDNFESSEITFEPRRLAEDFMQGKGRNGRASWKDIKLIKRDLYRLAHSRIFYHRWWNKELKDYTIMDTSIIDFVEVIEQGSENEACRIRIGWGKQIFNSIKAGYVGTYHLPALIRLRGYLDKALFFFLSKHLYRRNDTFVVHSCQNFARFKLGMRGNRVERGGRTSSSYVAEKLQKSLERVNKAIAETLDKSPNSRRIFAVRMTIDKSKDDYSLHFEKILGVTSEVKVIDQAQELVDCFVETFFSKEEDTYRQKIKDKAKASEWLEAYGFEKAVWMVKRCRSIHKARPKAREGVFSFGGLVFYEKDAARDYEQKKKSKAKEAEKSRENFLENEWRAFLDTQIHKYIDSLGYAKQASLMGEAEKRAREIEPHAWTFGTPRIQKNAIDRSKKSIIQERLGISKEAFLIQSQLSKKLSDRVQFVSNVQSDGTKSKAI